MVILVRFQFCHANSFVVVENHRSLNACTGCKKCKTNFVAKDEDNLEYSFICSVKIYRVTFFIGHENS